MCAQRDEFDKTSLDEFAHKIVADVNVTQKFSAHWIFTHGNTGQIILVDFSCILLLIAKIFEGFTKIESLLPGLAGGDQFGFGGRQGYMVLTATFPRNRSAIHHKNVASVRAARIGVASPICINPAPEFIGVSGATSVCNRLIPSVTQILQNVFSRLYVCDARKLDIFAELRIGPSQIGAGHSDKVTKSADNATIAAVEVRFGVGVTVIF